MLRVYSIFIGLSMMSILGNSEFMNNTNLYSILPARLECGRTFVVRPKGKHLATVVWLHELNQNGFSSYHLLEELPIRNIKWICPTAPRRGVSIHNGFPSTAWFNMLNFAEDARIDMDCLDAAAIHVSNLFSTEPTEIKLGVGGFGMGVAIALYSAACAVEGKLTNGRPYPGNISAAVGLTGWLPMVRFLMDKIIGSQEAVARAQSLPLLLCHGKDDFFVPYERGAISSEIFRSPLFQKLTSRTYDRLGHATNTEEMNEVCNWLTTNLALDGSD
ncbi:acyl-protein thioesterase 2-like isoform X1 [Papaver somniferum]|uniref:acyl-protein thioesterase 2-like isoform X1 n=1 Tax=Papaver somniferum TaxID=3469 RepID=UPI000E6FE4C7|nr:acyl-protein thioesterase 2-like isoform X1 [Papaver somniferum]